MAEKRSGPALQKSGHFYVGDVFSGERAGPMLPRFLCMVTMFLPVFGRRQNIRKHGSGVRVFQSGQQFFEGLAAVAACLLMICS